MERGKGEDCVEAGYNIFEDMDLLLREINSIKL